MRALFGFIGVSAGLLLGLCSLALSVLAWLEGGDLLVPLLPVEPENAAKLLGIGGVVGILASLMAIKRSLARFLLFIWWLAVTLVLVAAVFRGGYRFDGIEDFTLHGWMLLGALILMLSSWMHLRTPRRP